MQLASIDWVVIAICLAAAFAPAVFFARRASKGTDEFFASGRSAPWWLIGTSMVATTFSTDTPNLVTDFVRTNGVSQNWEWWAFLLTGMMTVFFYARMWRRSGVLTDLEFYELRYSGRSAAFVRGFRAVYLGLFFNCAIMASVTLAAVKIANVMLGWSRLQTVIICGLICVVFSAMAGLWGVMASDMIQFAIAMVGVIAAAYVALSQPEVGGLAGLVAKIDPSTLSLLPDFSNWGLTFSVLVIPLTIQWWSVWYPGAEPGGGSYIAQRMLAAKDEKNAMAATLWFNIAHYALRPWPWIIVALCSILVFPSLADIQTALPHVSDDLIGNDLAYPAMLTLLPAGLLGLLVASLLSAYVSTMSTHLNWGCSYLVHDLYRRFLKPDASERHLVWLSRVMTAVLMVVSGATVFLLSTAGEAFHLLLSIGAGTGLIYLLRWFWWRINAWSEIAAMASSFIIAMSLFSARKFGLDLSSHAALVWSVVLTTTVWVAVTFLTKPTDTETLRRFYRKVRPAGRGWAKVIGPEGAEGPRDSMSLAFLGWVFGCTFVYSGLFGTGALLYGHPLQGTVCLTVTLGAGLGLAWVVPKVWRESD
ncbi:MAG: Na+:solute symporter [Acidobacteria bacterium]|uniref:Na+:solute symporter n=1 Tax=Candidatus Sulfomarinibacter kjeldsenii TaxID=2885994 RepID=A0A8J7CFV6_9BACT|nr:Na+:solute symporter [Candidatus Sulfomarinibacter kjeldsenii]